MTNEHSPSCRFGELPEGSLFRMSEDGPIRFEKLDDFCAESQRQTIRQFRDDEIVFPVTERVRACIVMPHHSILHGGKAIGMSEAMWIDFTSNQPVDLICVAFK